MSYEETYEGPASQEFVENEKKKEKDPLQDDTVIEGPKEKEEACESCQ